MKINFLNKISTKPNKNTYTWNGNKSVIAMVLLYIIWFFRVLSLLQILKYLRRYVNEFLSSRKHLSKTDKDVGSKRINITPAFQEWYYIVWLIAISVFCFTEKWQNIIRIAEIYYIFESGVWILYYTVFRRFYEERYSIYHPLEHFLLMLIIIPTQAIAIADIYSLPFRDSLLALIGVGTALPGWVSALGVVYVALTISIVISNFPHEVSKAGRRHIIIGSGEVVSDKLLPALVKMNIRKKQISVFSLGEKREICGINVKSLNSDGKTDSLESITKTVSDEATVWISTPSHCHIYYLNMLLAYKPGMIVVEKPITVLADELEVVERIVASEYRKRIFFLSYYMLEKALPLIYFKRRFAFYERYIDFDNKLRSIELYHSLGKLKSISVFIKEGRDERKWVNESWTGGHLTETFIHNILIAAEFAGIPQKWDIRNFERTSGKQSEAARIYLNAVSGETEIVLEMIKNDKRYDALKQRGAVLVFENGKIEADFEKQDAMLFSSLYNESGYLKIKDRFKDKYQVQTDMVSRAFGFAVNPEDIDGYKNQTECLRWLMENM